MGRLDRVIGLMNGKSTKPTRPTCDSEEEFWKLIDKGAKIGSSIDADSNGRSKRDKQMKYFISTLASMENAEIIRFHDIFCSVWVNRIPRDKIDPIFEQIEFRPDVYSGKPYSEYSEAFFYAWLISQGRKVYNRVFKNPNFLLKYLESTERSFPDTPPYIMHKELPMVAHYAYRKKNSEDMSDRLYRQINLLGLRPHL